MSDSANSPAPIDSWFTIDRLDETTYIISEPGHWEHVHCYLVLGRDSALLIDSGLGIGDIRREVEALTDLPVRVVATHVHWDHIGGHGQFSEIMVHGAEAGWLTEGLPIPLTAVKADVVREPFTRQAPAGFDIDAYRVFRGRPTRILSDGDVIDLGGRSLKVLHTPGHSPGHMCFHEAERGYLFTGDLVYRGTIYAFYPSTDPVALHGSIERIARLAAVTRVLPGHHDLDVPVAMVARMRQALAELDRKGLVRQGVGTLEFGDFAFRF